MEKNIYLTRLCMIYILWIVLFIIKRENRRLIFSPLFIVVHVQLSPFPTTTTLPYPSYPHLPPMILTPSGFVHVAFIHVPWWSFPLSLPLFPPTSPLVTVSLFLISMSLVILCLLVCLLISSSYRWDHTVFAFHRLAYFTSLIYFEFILECDVRKW